MPILKQCFTCKKEKQSKEFWKDIRSKDGLFSNCKECSLLQTKNWRRNNPEKYLSTYTTYNNIEEVKIRRRKNSAVFSLTAKGIFISLKRRAERGKILFLLEKEQFVSWYEKQIQECYYCKRPLIECLKDKNFKDIRRLTIDRIDNTLGYLLNNLCLACSICNSTKSDLFTKEDMEIIGPLIFKRCKEKNAKN